jgi:hypothetical protein
VPIGIDRLAQDQAFIDIFEIDATATFSEQCQMVGLKVIAKERELESALPLKGAVARAAVAAESAEQWRNVPLEAGRLILSGSKP